MDDMGTRLWMILGRLWMIRDQITDDKEPNYG